MEDKRTSLNEAKRLAEDADNKKRTETRDKAIKAISAKLPQVVTFKFDEKNNIVEKTGNDADDKKEQPPAANDDEEEITGKKLSTMDAFAADLSLRESSRILVDWINLSGGNNGTATAQK